MSVCLAVDTVTATGSVALAVDGRAVAERIFGDRQHAALLLPSMLECLESADLRPADVEEVLVADGPGSFTGIRIGFATVCGFVSELSPRVFVASSMLASAVSLTARERGPVVALYDALRGEVFAACYSVSESAVHTIYPPHLTTVSALRALHAETPVAAIGDGARAHAAEVEAWTGRSPSQTVAHANNLIGLRGLEGGMREIHDISSFDPNYGRKAEAQVRWERTHGRQLSDSPGSG